MDIPFDSKKEPSLRSLRFVASGTILLTYMVLLYHLLTSPFNPSQPFPSDKIAHALAFGLLAILTYQTAQSLPLKKGALFSFLFASLYGLLGEYVQSRIPSRQADILDVLADTLGAALGILGTLLLSNLRKKGNPMQKKIPLIALCGMITYTLSAQADSPILGTTLFVTGIGFQFASSLTQAKAQNLYDQYLSTALQKQMKLLHHQSSTQQKKAHIFATTSHILLMTGTLVNTFHLLRNPPSRFSLSPHVHGKTLLLVLKKPF